MKKLNLSITTLLVLFSTATLADVNIVDTKNGSWVTVSKNGAAEESALVTTPKLAQLNQSFSTDENGRVFIPLPLNSSRSIEYKAVTVDGTEFSRSAFHGVSNR